RGELRGDVLLRVHVAGVDAALVARRVALRARIGLDFVGQAGVAVAEEIGDGVANLELGEAPDARSNRGAGGRSVGACGIVRIADECAGAGSRAARPITTGPAR